MCKLHEDNVAAALLARPPPGRRRRARGPARAPRAALPAHRRRARRRRRRRPARRRGTRLPTQRELAERLGTTIATVTRSYTEARRRGLVTATVGRGTFVRDGAYAPATSGIADLDAELAGADAVRRRADRGRLDVIDRDGLPRRCSSTSRTPATSAIARAGALGGAARRAASADEIVVTAGAQHGDARRAGDADAARATSCSSRRSPIPALISLANHLHLRLVPVPIDAGGLDSTPSPAPPRAPGRASLYLMPTLQNPTGVTLSAGRRKALLEVAIRHDVTLIEDDRIRRLLETRCRSPPTRRIAALHLTGVSKAVAPGLRVGLLRAPAALVPRLGAAVFAIARDGAAVRHGAGRDAGSPTDSPSASSPGSGRVPGAQPRSRARFSGCARSPPTAPARLAADARPLGAAKFVEQARLRGVLVSASQTFAVGREPPPTFVRICLGPPSTREALEAALRTLADVLREPPQPHRGLV